MSIDIKQAVDFLAGGFGRVKLVAAGGVAVVAGSALWLPADQARALRVDRITGVINEGWLQLGFWFAVIVIVGKAFDLAGASLIRVFNVARRREIAEAERLARRMQESVERLSTAQVRVLRPVLKGERVVFALREDYGQAESLVRSGVLERMPEGDEGTKRAYLVRDEAAIALLKSDKLVH